MKLPSGTVDQYAYFYAVDASDFKTPETGLSSFTVYRSRNGGAAAAMTTPTINETDSTNMPGLYELLVDEDTTIDSGNDNEELALHIAHAGMAPVVITVDLYRPKATLGETIGVTSGDVDTVTANTDMRGTDSAYTGTPPTSGAIADAVWDEPAAAHVAAGSTGEYLGGALQVLAIDGVTFATAAQAGMVDAVWDEAAADHVTAGTLGKLANDVLEDTGTAIPAAIGGLNDFDPANDTVAQVTLVDTTTTNSDMRGTDSAYTGTPPTATQNADALLNRDMAAVSDTEDRSPLNALRLLRNKYSLAGSTLTVTKEDDSTTAWTSIMTTDAAAEPITGSDPS